VKALGLTVPDKPLAVADEVIERARPPVRWRDWPRAHSVATRRRALSITAIILFQS
jgi:hypothetical protein